MFLPPPFKVHYTPGDIFFEEVGSLFTFHFLCFTVYFCKKEGIMGKNILIIAILLLLPSSILAFQNEPDGFRGIKWGTDIAALSGMTYESTDPSWGGVKKYSRKGETLSIGAAKLTTIHYCFWRDKLSSIEIKYKGYDNWTGLKNVLIEKFGMGGKPNRYMEHYIWFGPITAISAEYKELRRSGLVIMFSREIEAQQQQYEIENAKKGAKTGF
jgi:hypothetical protein